MVKPELGAKRTCPSCAARFYDLLKEPIECPHCEFTFVAEPLLPSKNDTAAKPKEEAAPKKVEESEEDDAVEVVSLEDVEEDDDSEDPDVAVIAEIEDVEIDDDSGGDVDSDKFLEEEEGGDDVSGIISPAVKGGGGEE